jgi:hypothetical protein
MYSFFVMLYIWVILLTINLLDIQHYRRELIKRLEWQGNIVFKVVTQESSIKNKHYMENAEAATLEPRPV